MNKFVFTDETYSVFSSKLSVCFWGLGDLGFRVSLFGSSSTTSLLMAFLLLLLLFLLAVGEGWHCITSYRLRRRSYQKRAVAISGLSYNFFNVFFRFCLYLFSSQQKQINKQNLNICKWCVCLNLFLTEFSICKCSVCFSLFLIELSSANALFVWACFWWNFHLQMLLSASAFFW